MGGGFHRNDQGLYVPKGCRIPDYKEYRIENVPELMRVKRRLAARGLADPWLRNEVWKYNTKHWGTKWGNIYSYWFKGIHYGLAVAIGVILFENVYFKKDREREAAEHHDHHLHPEKRLYAPVYFTRFIP